MKCDMWYGLVVGELEKTSYTVYILTF